jgi:hypothetical protein
MALKLNRPEDIIKLDGKTFPQFKEFYGQNVAQMPKLIEAGRNPVSVAQLMQRRLELRNAPEDIKSSWMDNYFDMSDAIGYHPDGRIKVDLDSQTLREMTPETSRTGGALILTEDSYNTSKGEEFTREKLGKTETPPSKKNAKAHPVWKTLARDQALLNDYVDLIFAEGRERFGYDTAMDVYLDFAGDQPKMRALCVDRLEGGSSAYGGNDLAYGSGRFVGLAPEAQIALGKPIQRVRAYRMEDVQKAESQLAELRKVVKPDSLDDVTSLVASL